MELPGQKVFYDRLDQWVLKDRKDIVVSALQELQEHKD